LGSNARKEVIALRTIETPGVDQGKAPGVFLMKNCEERIAKIYLQELTVYDLNERLAILAFALRYSPFIILNSLPPAGYRLVAPVPLLYSGRARGSIPPGGNHGASDLA